MIKIEIKSCDWYNELIVSHNNKEIARKEDCIEPEDVDFTRGLAWIKDLLEEVYKLGYDDGYQYVYEEEITV